VNFHNDDQTKPDAGIPERMTTVASKLHDLGYSTHQVGKWHCGHSSASRIPTGKGFDTSLGYFDAYNGYITSAGHLTCPQNPKQRTPESIAAAAARHGINVSCTARSITARNLHQAVDLWDTDAPAKTLNGTEYEETLFVNRVVSIIENHVATNLAAVASRAESRSKSDGSAVDNAPVKPLFVYYAMHLLHSPLCAPRDILAKFDHIGDDDRKHVAAMLLMADDVVGRVVSALKRTGLWANTLLVWSTDNGAAIERVSMKAIHTLTRSALIAYWPFNNYGVAIADGSLTRSPGRRVLTRCGVVTTQTGKEVLEPQG
jgi:arylsulfatase I/J